MKLVVFLNPTNKKTRINLDEFGYKLLIAATNIK
jgi:hypothetical protein